MRMILYEKNMFIIVDLLTIIAEYLSIFGYNTRMISCDLNNNFFASRIHVALFMIYRKTIKKPLYFHD